MKYARRGQSIDGHSRDEAPVSPRVTGSGTLVWCASSDTLLCPRNAMPFEDRSATVSETVSRTALSPKVTGSLYENSNH